jgi:hypothetical protein
MRVLSLEPAEIKKKCEEIVERNSKLTPFPDLMRKTTFCEIADYGEVMTRFHIGAFKGKKVEFYNEIILSKEYVDFTKNWWRKSHGLELNDEEAVEVLVNHEFAHAFDNAIRARKAEMACKHIKDEKEWSECIIEKNKSVLKPEELEVDVERIAHIIAMKVKK